MSASSAIVLFSGGQDSATCLAWALSKFDRVETLGFDYGQRHRIELQQRQALREKMVTLNPLWAQRLGEDHTLDLKIISEISQTAMTSEMEITYGANGLPNTFVPGRNLIFLTFAAVLAYRRGLTHIVGGMCETDFSGYPDCRDDAVKAMQLALNIGMDKRFVLDTPLMWLNKAQTWKLAEDLGGKPLADLIVEDSHTCYLGERGAKHDWGHGCGTCPACELRAKGFAEYRSKA